MVLVKHKRLEHW